MDLLAPQTQQHRTRFDECSHFRLDHGIDELQLALRHLDYFFDQACPNLVLHLLDP